VLVVDGDGPGSTSVEAGCNANDSSDSKDTLDSTDFSRAPLPDATGPLEAVVDRGL
jgi:hypothetical protein